MTDTDTPSPAGDTAAPADPAPVAKPRRRARTGRLLLWMLAQILVLALVLAGFVLGTQTGLRLAIAAVDDFAPGVLEVGQVRGRLLGALHLRDLRVSLPGLDLGVGGIDLDWSPSALLGWRVQVHELSARDIDILAAASPEQTSEPFELPRISLPIGVELDHVLVERLRFNQTGAPPEAAFRLERAELSATALGEEVALRRLAVRLPEPLVDASATGQAQLHGDYPLRLDLSWTLERAPAMALRGSGSVTGDLASLLVRHRVSGSIDLSLDARIDSLLKAPSWEGELELTRVDLPRIVADAPPVNLQARLTTRGTLEDADLKGQLSGDAADLPDFGKLSAELDLNWKDRVLDIRAVRLNETKSGAMLDLDGRVDVGHPDVRFELAGVWEHLRWPLTGEAIAESPKGRVDADGTLDAFTYRLRADALGAGIPETVLALDGDGDAGSTRIQELTIDTLGGRLTGKGRLAWTPVLSWDLALAAAQIDPGHQWPGLAGELALKAESKGGLDDGFDYKLKLNAELAAYPPAVVNLAGTGTDKAARITTLSVETLGGLLEGGGDVTWDPALDWDLTLNATDIDPGRQWQGLAGRIALAASSKGGLAQGFGFQLDADANLAAYPPAKLHVRGTGTGEAARIEALNLDGLGGRVAGQADVAWAPAVAWNTEIDITDIDPGQYDPAWPGRLSGSFSSQGELTAAGADLGARIKDFGGTLRGYPVRVVADLAMQGKDIEVRELIAGSGDTQVSVKGRAGDRLDFGFRIDSPDLGAVLPDAKGRLAADGRISGTLEAPRVNLKLDARDVELNGQGIEQIAGNADVGLGEGDAFRIDIDAEQLIAGGQRFDTLRVRGTGSMASHRLELALAGSPLALGLTATGALKSTDGGSYRGSLQKLSLATQVAGTWGLQRPADFSLDQGRVNAGPLCIGDGKSSGGCASFAQERPGQFDASLDIGRIDLGLLNPLLPEMTVMKGFVRAKARFKASDSILDGSATVEVPSGDVQVALPDTADKIVFAGTRLDLRSGRGGLDATLALPLQGLGRANGKLSLPGFRLAGGEAQTVRGSLDARLENLARISNLVPDLTDVSGGVDANLRIGGTLTGPEVQGRVVVNRVGLRVPLIGLRISELNLSAVTRGPRAFDLDGGANVGGGQLSIDGGGVQGSAGWSGHFTVKGDRLRVADSKEYMALVSTDLRGGFGPGGGALQGEISIPKANIRPRTIPSGAISPSPDVVMEDAGTKSDPTPLHIDVLVRLGNSVKVDAFGLRGRLRGSLHATQEPGRPMLGDGQLEVVDGSYRLAIPGDRLAIPGAADLLTSIGRPLTIKQGIVVFANTPIDNPGLILNAQREGGDVTAGVRVLGTLRKPKLAFFSESDPNMTQAEITTYLVTGVPPKRGAAAESQALSVGTYVAPKLFMEYESSLGDQGDKVKLRYDLTKHIELQTETGDSQGGDVFFKFEN